MSEGLLSATVIRNLRLPGGVTDLAINDGRIAAFSRHGAEEVDGAGMVPVPRLTDSHLHLDKTLLGGSWFPHKSGGGIADRIKLERDSLDKPEMESTYIRAERLLQRPWPTAAPASARTSI